MPLKLYHTTSGAVAELNNSFYQIGNDWNQIVNRENLYSYVLQKIQSTDSAQITLDAAGKILPPIGNQELWAAGVTYVRSKVARMEESEQSGAARFYDLVYEAERPELFFKSAAWRVQGSGGKLKIRRDSTWNVPEPELTLFISSAGTIEGYTVGNDMSSRSIEGENPLYLPQAKIFDGCAALGPCLLILDQPISASTEISMKIFRNGQQEFSGSAVVGQMKRSLNELAGWLTRELSFPDGVMLMTGTCIVPPDNFTLQTGDQVSIQIEGIGLLENLIA
jgi:2-dehydro-3-deoxy-D-arabinonate dehydratase